MLSEMFAEPLPVCWFSLMTPPSRKELPRSLVVEVATFQRI